MFECDVGTSDRKVNKCYVRKCNALITYFKIPSPCSIKKLLLKILHYNCNHIFWQEFFYVYNVEPSSLELFNLHISKFFVVIKCLMLATVLRVTS